MVCPTWCSSLHPQFHILCSILITHPVYFSATATFQKKSLPLHRLFLIHLRSSQISLCRICQLNLRIMPFALCRNLQLSLLEWLQQQVVSSVDLIHATVSAPISFEFNSAQLLQTKHSMHQFRSSHVFPHTFTHRRSDQSWSSPILRVAYSSTTSTCRLTITASCPMDLQYFPMDRQLCFIEIESCKYFPF